MGTPGSGTPFIPPLGSPQNSPGVQPPVIPLGNTPSSHSQSRSQGNSGANTPAHGMPGGGGWGGYPSSGGYPPFGMGTPYTAQPFIPLSPYTPAGAAAGFSPLPPQGPTGLSLDYTGYPSFGSMTPYPGMAPLGGGGAAPVHPSVVPNIPSQGTPWHAGGNLPHLQGAGAAPAPAPAGHGASAPPGTPWFGPGGHPAQAQAPAAAAAAAAASRGAAAGAYQPFGPPLSAGGFGGYPSMGGGGWGGMGQFTPGPAPDPWHMGGGWGAGIGPSMGMGMAGMAGMGGMSGMGGMAGMAGVFPGVQPPTGGGQGPPSRVNTNDRMPPWTIGKHYGPVLEPLQLKVVGAQLKVNPLISLAMENSGGDYLKWNMLFPTNHVQRSSDPDHISWSKGRDEPATFPRLTQLKLISEMYPWTIEVKAKDLDVGVTCGEVIEAIGTNLSKMTGKEDYEAMTKPQQKQVREAYTYNRSRAPGVPGGALGQGMRRMDFLGKMTTFAGVEMHETTVKKVCGVVPPGCVVLRCKGRQVLTAEELKVQEDKQRAAARAASRATSRTSSRSGQHSRRAGSTTSSGIGIGVHSASDEETNSDESD